MFDIGFWELLLIGIVTLVVVGPERLPDVARTAGVYIAKLRRFVAGVKSDINAELETGELKKILGDQREQIRELKDIVDTTRKEMETSVSDVSKEVGGFSKSMEDRYKDMAETATETIPTGGNSASITSFARSDSTTNIDHAPTPDDNQGATTEEPSSAAATSSGPGDETPKDDNVDSSKGA